MPPRRVRLTITLFVVISALPPVRVTAPFVPMVVIADLSLSKFITEARITLTPLLAIRL